jgi:hypothetical protein
MIDYKIEAHRHLCPLLLIILKRKMQNNRGVNDFNCSAIIGPCLVFILQRG